MRQRAVAAVLAAFWMAVAAGAAGAETLERVQATGVFKLGFREDAAPFSFRSALGEPSGYAVDLCRAVAVAAKERLGLDAVTLEYVPVAAERRFDAIAAGEIDILCGPATITLSRRAKVDFSLPIFNDGASVLYRQDGPARFEDLAGETVGVREGTTTAAALRNTLARLELAAEVLAVGDHADGLAQLEAGAISAYFADQSILYFLAATSAAPEKLRLSDRRFTYETYGLAFARGDAEFRLLVDATLARIYRSDQIERIFRAAFGPRAVPSATLKALYIINRLPE
ncbi:MAG: amino acid ABC transporter substrate-binding protein [Pseudomonadota bacterium]